MLGAKWAFEHADASQPFTIVSGSITQTLYLRDIGGTGIGSIRFSLNFQNSAYDSVDDFMAQLNASKVILEDYNTNSSKLQEALALSLSGSLVDGQLSISAPEAPAGTKLGLLDSGGDTNFSAQLSSLLIQRPDFDLDTMEFGLVDSAYSTLATSELGDAAKVAALLNQLFQFDANGEDGVLNTSVFAVTAHDDPNATAIWAHRQSSANDSTVEAIELYQLAQVNTLGHEFDWHNFAQAQPMVV